MRARPSVQGHKEEGARDIQKLVAEIKQLEKELQLLRMERDELKQINKSLKAQGGGDVIPVKRDSRDEGFATEDG
ncbi:MAG: hypothetical protein ACTSW4_07775 [Candidatus Ranarchaeia archaeon]